MRAGTVMRPGEERSTKHNDYLQYHDPCSFCTAAHDAVQVHMASKCIQPPKEAIVIAQEAIFSPLSGIEYE
jgi:hypothetical protein